MASSEINGNSSRRNSRRRMLPRAASTSLLVESIANASYRSDFDPGPLELRAQPGDIHLDRVLAELRIPTTDGAQETLLTDYLRRVEQQALEYRPLAPAQLHRLALQRRAVRAEIHAQRAVLDARAQDRFGAADEGTYACYEFRDLEWLRHVVVCA